MTGWAIRIGLATEIVAAAVIFGVLIRRAIRTENGFGQ